MPTMMKGGHNEKPHRDRLTSGVEFVLRLIRICFKAQIQYKVLFKFKFSYQKGLNRSTPLINCKKWLKKHTSFASNRSKIYIQLQTRDEPFARGWTSNLGMGRPSSKFCPVSRLLNCRDGWLWKTLRLCFPLSTYFTLRFKVVMEGDIRGEPGY